MSSSERIGRSRYRLDQGRVNEWLAARGWWGAKPSSVEQRALVADEIAAPRYTLRRLWHTAATLEYRNEPGPDAADRLRVIFLVDGEAKLSVDGLDHRLRSDDVAVIPDGHQLGLVTESPTARIEADFPCPPVLSLRPFTLFSSGTRAASVASEVFLSTVNATLNSDGTLSPPFLQTLQKVLEDAVELLFVEADRPPLQRDARRLYMDALAYIETWGHGTDMTVESLVEAMGVSRQYLSRVFARRGTSPGLEIRRHRLRLSDRLRATGLVTAEEAALTSGFGSVRAMQRAQKDRGVAG
ncbi:hypothetical protein ACO03V_12660 [Microbacterium sp. HMH0099]|uniref:helix-turn-helix transcriptional regulator n=1 Tax=Microbacterium sp. HMH0099 TaxID=3414026 RepID=UPI003BF6C743